MQQGQHKPKWEPRARQAIYLGHSPRHAQTVPVVFNRHTGLYSLQYHVVFDDLFTMVPHTNNSTPPSNWPDLFQDHHCNMLEDELEIAEKLQIGPE
ncbi:MAG: hypothetical protein ACK53Y_13420 [bacterium]